METVGEWNDAVSEIRNDVRALVNRAAELTGGGVVDDGEVDAIAGMILRAPEVSADRKAHRAASELATERERHEDRLSPSAATRRSRMGAYARLAREDPRDMTAAARAVGPASMSYWERQVDPDCELPPQERTRRAEHAKKLHMLRLSLKSKQARAKRKAAS